MSRQQVTTFLLTGAALLLAAGVTLALGPVGGLAAGAIALSLLCAASLYLSTREEAGDAGRTLEDAVRQDAKHQSSTGQGATPAVAAGVAPASEPAAGGTATADKPAAPSSAADSTPGAAEADNDPATPAPTPAGAAPPRDLVSFSYESFAHQVLGSHDAVAALRSIADGLHARDEDGADALLPVERFLMRQLDEAGLATREGEDELPRLQAVRPAHSGTFYLRGGQSALPYGSYLRVIRIEAALNALHYAHEYFGDLSSVGEQDLYRLAQRLVTTVCAQADDVQTIDWSYLAMPWQMPVGPSERGEWAVRQALSEAIESVRVPYRLEARFRANVAEGNVALEVRVTPAEAFPRSAYVDGLGIVPTTASMRRREAARYAARVGLLLANHAFRASERVRRVWVAGVLETPSSRTCWYAGRIGRRDLARVRMAHVTDPLATLRALGVSLQETDEGALVGIPQGFYLEDEAFCPHVRHDLWKLSERPLPAAAALALGTTRVSGLMIHEELSRSLAADDMLRGLADPHDQGATQRSVRTVLDVAHATSDMGVWAAAERVAARLVDGTLDPSDPEALRSEMVHGDALTHAVELAQECLARQEFDEVIRLLDGALSPLDDDGAYADTPAVAYRCFDSFTERVLYNRLNHTDERSVVLVPDAYLIAHLTLSAVLAMMPEEAGGSVRRALAHARRAVEVAPLNAPANLGVVACLERLGELDEAREQLNRFLEVAYNPQGIGMAYHRMAAVQWALGNHEACQACYQRGAQVMPALMPVVLMECQSLMAQGARFREIMDERTVGRVLARNGIPLAPTPRTSYLLYDGATASVDAEVFPVARDLLWVIESFTGDDVLRGIRSSLEREPDA